jgi:PAS domain S-box-containing protein
VVLPTVVGLVLFVAAVFAFILPVYEEGLLARKEEMIQELTHTVCGILARLEEHVQNGELTRAEAQAEALDVVRSLRYGAGGKGYFWINDRRPRMLLHPYRPDLEGQDLTEEIDPDGWVAVQEGERVVREYGEGFVRYNWQRRGDRAHVVPKLSYVYEFAPWSWVVGTGVYLDDVARERAVLVGRLIAVTTAVLGIVAVLAAVLIWQGARAERRRRAAESALRESEANYRRLIESMNDGLAAQDEHGQFTFVNDRFCQILGRERSALVGHVVTEYMRVDARKTHDARMAERRLGAAESYEIAWLRSDGTEVTTIITPQILRDARGEYCGSFAVVTDISARRDTELALRRSERRLAMLMSNLPGMAYRCRNDPEWTMEFVSEGCLSLTGYPSSDLLNNRALSYADLIHPDDREGVWDEVQRGLAAKRPFRLTYRIIARGGEERWVWEQGQAAFDADGQLEALEGFITDITERKRAEEERERLAAQLRQSQKMEAVGQLAGGVAHDFNNILTAILGNVELALAELQRRFPEEAPLLEELGQIERSANRASMLTRQLLAFSRRQVAQPQIVDLNRTLAEVENMLRRLLAENIVLDLQLSSDLRSVHIDPGQLGQVLLNLVVNARDAMPDGGRLTVATTNVVLESDTVGLHGGSQTGPHVLLTVSDTGCGMDAETVEHIFEPFFTTKPPGQGTGLGLATVYGIVQQAGGSIAVDSQPERGTAFRVYLPAVDAVAPATAAPAPMGAAASGGDETILVCEDDETVRGLTAQMLRDAGYQVLAAVDGPAALEMAAAFDGPIHLLLTDVIMPDMNGRELADVLREQRPGLRTLFVSGYTADVIAHHGVLDDGLELLEKPYRRQALLERVRRILG